MKIEIKKIILPLVAVALLAMGCEREMTAISQTNGEKVIVQMKTKAFVGSELENVKIEKVRFILFQDDVLLNNYTTSNGTMTINSNGEFDIAVSPGEYSFAAIINESPELTEKLNAVSKRTDIDEIKIDWQNSAFTAQNILLVNLGNMKIVSSSTPGKGMAQLLPTYNSEGSRYGGSYTAASATASIDMPRALSQVSLFLRQGEAVTDKVIIKSVEIVNVPRYSYLVDQQAADNVNMNFFTGPETEISATEGDIVHNSKQYHSFSSAIIAEKSFYKDGTKDETLATNEENAAYLFINATYGGVPTSYKILLREKDADFSLLRNTNYNVYATITQIGSKGIYVVIEPIKIHDITVNWSPVEGLVIVSDREADFGKDIDVWNDYTVYSGILKVYKGSYYDVLFKYGSLIAIKNDATATSEQAFVPPTNATATEDVLWYPGSSFDVTQITNWNTVPYITDGSSFTSGNTQELVGQGKGDPCRLAALSPYQIGVEKKTDNQQWHMATPTEYALLMKAANGTGSENDNGYRSFHELLIPNVKYRDENGTLQSAHNNQGNYWSTEQNQAFSFNSQDLTKTTFPAATPERGYSIRCVRNSIPNADITITAPSIFYYYGAATNGASFFVNSNVPYWKLELITNGEHKGTSDDFDDFSFAPLTAGAEIKHSVEGSYSQTPKAYIARRVSRTENRSFGVKFTSIHFNGEEETYYFMLTQYKYDIVGKPTIDGINKSDRIPVGEGTYTIHITLSPGDVPMPVGASLQVEYTYLNTVRGTSNIVTTTAEDKYDYDVTLKITDNGTPDVIGLIFNVYMTEGGIKRKIGGTDYYQNNK